MAEVTILGAGVAGLCVATELAARGLAPRVIDPAGGPGAQGCSWWAGGMLAPECESVTAEAPVVRLGREAADWWARHTAVTRAGSLVIAPARDRGELDRFARRSQRHERVDAAALEPDLPAHDALHYPREAHLDPRAALRDLARGLAARGIAIARDGARRGTVIDCRGLAARDALPDLRGVRGEMLMLRSRELTLARPVRLLHPRHPLYVVPRGDGVFMLGATQLESDATGPVTARALLELLSAAYALHPAFAEAELVETGADARPAFADNLPRIRRHGDVIHVNGLFRHGFLLAPALARMVAELVTEGRIPEVMDEDRDQRHVARG